MNVDGARREALKIAGRIAADRIERGKRRAVKFGEALIEYMDHLEAKVDRAGKPARWARNVEQLALQHLRPQWEKWTLAEMSAYLSGLHYT